MGMRKITFNADADLLDRAEQIAKAKGTTLEEEVRQWLDDFGREDGSSRHESRGMARVDEA